MIRIRWVLGLICAAAIISIPFAYFRAGYVHSKRLRIVTDGKFYRSGQLPAEGFRDAVRQFDLRCIVNLQEENHVRDPHLPETWLASWFGRKSILESDLAKSMGIKYLQLDGGVLDRPEEQPDSRPKVIDDFLKICDDPDNYPMLIHCKAGLHRTGLMTAIYRMEYENRDKAEVVKELRANGFGTFAATEDNDYMERFISRYQKGLRLPSANREAGR